MNSDKATNLSTGKKPETFSGIFRSKLAAFLIIGGLLGTGYFLFFFDTSVDVPEGEDIGITSVNNLGLMHDRQLGMICCLGAAATGGFIEFYARSRK